MIEFFCIHCVNHWIFHGTWWDPKEFTEIINHPQIDYSKCKCDYVNELPNIPLGYYYG